MRIIRFAALLGAALVALLAIASAATAAERGYELVSPADKGSTDAASPQQLPFASENGDVSTYAVFNALPGGNPSSNGVLNQYRSVRGPEGWSATQINSVLDAENTLNSSNYNLFSSDLMVGVQGGPLSPPATADAADGTNNLYLHDASGFRLITVGADPFDPEFFAEPVGGSADLSRVVISVANFRSLNDESPPGVRQLLYEWDTTTETPKIVGRLPGGAPSPDAVSIATPPLLGGPESVTYNSVSADGTRIFFYTPEGSLDARELYVRIDGTETKHVSESQRMIPDLTLTPGPTFRFAADDGSVVYFTSHKKLTDDATTGPNDEGEDLYRYEVESGELTDVSVDLVDPAGADVQGVLGTSADGSRVYFAARGVLATGAVAGQNNLYLWTNDDSPEGEITLVATDIDKVNWSIESPSPSGGHITARVTADGSRLLFESAASLTGYANEGHLEAYLYDADTEQLVCASCNPAGTPATADAIAAGAGEAVHLARTLSADGKRVFFATAEQLVPGDTNTVADAYEFDAETGQINLISTGEANSPSLFSDASADGADALFITRQRLVGIDRDDNFDVYDARIGGGIAAQNPPPAPAPCEGEACRLPVGPPPPASTPTSSQVSGPGNPKPRHRHKHRKKHKHRKHNKQSNQSRRGIR